MSEPAENKGSKSFDKPPKTETSRATRYARPASFFLLFLPYVAFLVKWSLSQHYTLPEPVTELYHPTSGLPQFSEAKALDYIRHYAEDIGYRIVGTPEMDETVKYTMNVIEDLKSQATGPNVEIEISLQQGDGNHLFDFMDKKVWKKYLGIQNVVARLSNGTDASKENAILVNAHLDSTLPSPGASDDAAGVAIMLEALRVMSQTPDLSINHAIIFLFNGAEESFQDASHLFITQHAWRDTIRAVVNLEAAGTSGSEMLFQATSTEMIKAFSHAPRPNGQIIATEVFSTGVIPSYSVYTDFRQFEQYGGLTGLDFALVRDSYKYHTRLDTVQYLESGAVQHFGENILAILSYLTSTPTGDDLRNIRRTKEMVYYTALGGRVFVMLKASHATVIYAMVFLLSLVLAWARMRRDRLAGYIVCFLSIPASLISGLVAANITAVFMSNVLDKPLSYFRREWFCMALYGVPTLLGIASCQYLTALLIRRKQLFKEGENILQHALLISALVYNATAALVGQLLGMLSSYIWIIAAVSMLITISVNDYVLVRGTGPTTKRGVSIMTYLIGQTVGTVVGAEGLLSFLDVIVPLTGRLGAEAPGDVIVASLVAGVLFLSIPTFPALCHRWGSTFLSRLVVVLLFATGIIVSIFAAPSWQPFDATHPKRVLCLYMENITSNDLSLHVASIDGANNIFSKLVKESSEQLGLLEEPSWSDISDDIPDWDIIYPISQFLQSYKVPLPALPSSYVSPFKDSFKVELLESRLNAVQQTRYLRLAVRHPEIIWTVIAFEADVVSWDLPESPERGMIRHHVKEASAYKYDSWELTLTVQLTKEQFEAAQRISQRRKGQRQSGSPEEEEADRMLAGLRIDYSGLDVNRMWHDKADQKREGMEFLERLDKVLPAWTDPMLLTAVAGVAHV